LNIIKISLPVIGILWLAANLYADVSLKPVAGRPVLADTDGQEHSRLIFAGTSLGSPVAVGPEWQLISYQLNCRLTDDRAFVQINFAGQNGQLDICDLRITTEPQPPRDQLPSEPFTSADWSKKWKLIDAKKIGVSSTVGKDGMTITVPRRQETPWDVQLCSQFFPVRAGITYTVSFRMRARCQGSWPVTSYLMRTDPLRFYSAAGVDQFLATSTHFATKDRAVLSPCLALPWPENPADYEQEMAPVADYLNHLVQTYPNSVFLLRIGVEPPSWWIKTHPEEMLRWANGRTARYVSASSEKWRQAVKAHLLRLVALLEKNWGKRIIAYLPIAQSSGEWYYPIWENTNWGDMNFDIPFLKEYQQFLHAKYGDIASLNKAWGGQSLSAFSAIAVPSGKSRRVALLEPFRDPTRQRELFDFAEYQQTALREALENVAEAIKAASGKPVIAFYGYSFELPGCRDGIATAGHLQIGKLLRSKSLDGIVDITSYYDRGVAGSGALMAPAESVTAHGKLYFTEDDSRTHLSAANAGYERSTTPENTAWALNRNLVRSLVHRGYSWKFDLYGNGWYNDPALWPILRNTEQAAATLPPEPFRSDIAVVVDERSYLTLAPGITLTRPLVYEFRSLIARSGLGEPSWWLLDDVVEGLVPPPKLMVFLNAFYLDRQQRNAISDYCKKNAVTALWLYAPGYLNDCGEDFAGMQTLTGFSFQRFRLPAQSSRQVTINAQDMKFKGSLTLTENLDEYFTVRDTDIDILGRFANGFPALAYSKQAGYSSYFCAAPRLSADLLAALGRKSGAWQYVKTGNIVITDGRLMSITSPGGGLLEISLPRTCSVRTSDGQAITSSSDHFSITFKPGETKVFILSPITTQALNI